jgi:DNA (cytosine-5)-methyltransferase 1
MKSSNPNSGIYEADTARTLDLNGGNPVCNQGGMLVVQPALIEMTSTKNTVVEDGICPTLTARMCTGGNQVNAVIDSRKADEGSAPICIDVGFVDSTEETAPPLLARQYKDTPVVHWEQYARRLTELECERLQGFPDYWTDIGNWVDSKGKTRNSSSQKRYEAIGNSIALPFWFWLMRRISAQYPRPATLGSLFDGIGGFPLVWERCNGKGTAIWASEIEEFCIAVTKKHFPEEEEK